jgi:hypothetical protein
VSGPQPDDLVPLCKYFRVYWLWTGPPRGGERGGGIAPGPQVPLEIFCWAPVIFLEEIFPRKGQEIWFFGQSTEIWYKKIEVKSLESNCNVLVGKIFPPKKLSTGPRGGGGGVLRKKGALKNKICPGLPPSSRRPWLWKQSISKEMNNDNNLELA